MAARRGKSQARRTNEPGRGLPGWAWLGIGLVAGLGAAAWVLHGDGLLDRAKLFPQPEPNASAPRDPEPPIAQRPAPAEPAKPKYDFYTVLTEREVQIPEAELSAQVQDPTPEPDTGAGGDRFFLQAGAFGDVRGAEEVKAAIAFSGLVARIEPTTTSGGRTVHRVMLGPFASARDLEQAKASLDANGIPSIALRQPPR